MRNTEQVTSTFGERLIEALEYQGITDGEQQVEVVAQACGVTAMTAKKYLQSDSCPVFLNRNYRRLVAVAKSVEADSMWLFDGDGLDPQEMQIVKLFRSMSAWEKTKYMRFLIRLRNNDAKALRLGGMFEAGQISCQQLFSMI